MQSHTPGPWHVGGRGGVCEWDIEGPNGEDIAYANPSDGADDPTLYPVAANARLIAAAPDLLEACKLALEQAGELRGGTRRGRIRDAIEKAEAQ